MQVNQFHIYYKYLGYTVMDSHGSPGSMMVPPVGMKVKIHGIKYKVTEVVFEPEISLFCVNMTKDQGL